MRLLPRLLAAIVYALVPLASEERLGETALISTGAGIGGFVVIWETIGSLECGASVFESWSGRVANFETVIDVGSRKKRTNSGRLVGDQPDRTLSKENDSSVSQS